MERKNFIKAGLFPLCLFLIFTGCGSSIKQVHLKESMIDNYEGYKFELGNIETDLKSVPSYIIERLDHEINIKIKENGLLADASGSENVLKLNVNIKKYKDRGGFSRFMWGVFAGSDHMESEVTILKKPDNLIIADATIRTYNATALGSMDYIVKKHAEEIIDFVKNNISDNE